MILENQSLLNRLNLLLEVNLSINSTINLNELLTKITNVTSAIMSAEASSIALIDQQTDELVFSFVQGEASQIIKTMRVPIGKGISGWVAKYAVTLVVPDAQNDPRFSKDIDQKSSFITRSVICVPLIRSNKVIGILQSLNKKDGGTFSGDDITIFESLAGIAAIAIENARLYELLNQRLIQLEEAKQRNDYILNQLKSYEEESEKLKKMIQTKKGSFFGELGVFRVENIIQMLSNDYKSGKLTLNSIFGQAFIFFENGKIKHVEITNRELKGLNAFYETVCWTTGSFYFEEGLKTENTSVDKTAITIVIEGLRRFDEYNLLVKKYPESFIPLLKEINFEELIDHPDCLFISRNCDGKKSLAEIINTSSLDRYSFFSALNQLLAKEIVSF